MGEFQTVVCEFHFFIISPPPFKLSSEENTTILLK